MPFSNQTGLSYSMKNEWRVLAGVFAVVIGVYAYAAHAGFMAMPDQQAADTYYNRLVKAFQAGQLNLKVDVPDSRNLQIPTIQTRAPRIGLRSMPCKT